jgi:hypothetical protein
MLRTLLFAIGIVSAASSFAFAQEPSKRTFRAITVESDSICRAWLIPSDEALATKRLKSKQIPVSYVEELGLIHLTGRMRHKDSITIDDLLKSKKLDGIDLSYIDVKDDELIRISKRQSLRHLYLSGVKLSDTMIDTLGRMTQLEYLNLFETNLTAKQIEELAARIPSAKLENKKPDGLAAACDGYLHLELSK